MEGVPKIMPSANFDFGGYATRTNLKCTDGRVILPGAFSENDGTTVPLVWQHMHNEPSNVLGHAVLENRDDGVYAYGFFNESEDAQKAKLLVKHGDITALSIYANSLVEKSKQVAHGIIREVSLVLSGANPGAKIDNIAIAHADGSFTDLEDEAVITMGLALDIPEEEFEYTEEDVEAGEEFAHADPETIGDVFETLSEKQKKAVYAIIGQIIAKEKAEAAEALKQSAIEEPEEVINTNIEEGDTSKIMKTNVFDGSAKDANRPTLTHSEFQGLVNKAIQMGGSLKQAFENDEHASAVLAHAGTYGIDDISYLFPDAQNVTKEPTFIAREMGWVSKVMNNTRHTPFSRIKSLHANVTADEARALGYITGNQKAEEVFPILRRTTQPTTIYKLQKLDRDDVVDITDFNVVAWLKREMRFMLDEELARAVLVGDGRSGASNDKIAETSVRPIWGDDAVYTYHAQVAVGRTDDELIDDMISARVNYRGAGNPTLFVAPSQLTAWLLLKDADGRRLYRSVDDLALEFRVKEIVEVPIMEGLNRTPVATQYNLRAIMVNLADYTMGADKGGEINLFDDFDIDFNQYKYLIETRVSGALVTPSSAIVLEQANA